MILLFLLNFFWFSLRLFYNPIFCSGYVDFEINSFFSSLRVSKFFKVEELSVDLVIRELSRTCCWYCLPWSMWPPNSNLNSSIDYLRSRYVTILLSILVLRFFSKSARIIISNGCWFFKGILWDLIFYLY
jgi:hypothetical protein